MRSAFVRLAASSSATIFCQEQKKKTQIIDLINEENCKDTNSEYPWRSHNKIEDMIHNSGPGNGKNSVPNRRTCHGDSSDVAKIL